MILLIPQTRGQKTPNYWVWEVIKIVGTLTATTTPSQNGSESNDIEVILLIPQTSGRKTHNYWVWEVIKISTHLHSKLSKLLTSADEKLYMASWSIPLCLYGQVHSLDYNWFADLCVDMLVYNYSFNLVLLQELCWVTNCFDFVC